MTDAKTGRPIGTFTVVPSVQMNGNMTVWMPGFAKTHHGGRFEFPLDSLGTQPHRVRIEAEDYRAAVSPIYATTPASRSSTPGWRKASGSKE